MNKGLIGFIFFIAGGFAGFEAANKLLKDRYEQLVQEEIESVKAAFRAARPSPKKKSDEAAANEEREQCVKVVNELGYSQEKEPAQRLLPRVIPPNEFGELGEYEQVSLTLYADGTVTDENDRAMSEDEIEESVGRNSLDHFGEYEADSVFVRNDRLKVDYEILADQRTYADLLREKPWLIRK